MTTEQFLALPDEFDKCGNRIKQELIAGEIVSVASASALHDLIKNRIGKTVMLFLASQRDSDVEALIEISLAVSERNSFQPDVCVIKKTRLREVETRILTGAPEIAIEVVSPSDFAADLKHKIHAYLANGSASVWVVYPEDRSIDVHTKAGIRELAGDQPIEDATLPGFSQSVSSFFEGL
jgi:Uma2 family endonuclease